MKLIASSQVPTDPLPYLHLGYVAATAYDTSWVNPNIFFAVTICSFVFFLAYHKHRVLSGIGFAISAGCVITILTLLILTASARGPYRYGIPPRATESHISEILSEIERHAGDKQTPGTLTEMQHAWTFRAANVLEDGWRRPFRLKKIVTKQQTTFTLTSAGPDGKFDTADDIWGEMRLLPDGSVERGDVHRSSI